jgi:predicted methyltransferase
MRRLFALGLAVTLLTTVVNAAEEPLERARTRIGNSTSIARDSPRHPREVLMLLSIRPDASVVEIWPVSGYWPEILAPYLYAQGIYHVALGDAGDTDVEKAYAQFQQSLQDKIAANPASFGHVQFTQLDAERNDIAPPNSADLVSTFRNFHNWMKEGDTAVVLAAVYRALKPASIFGVEDHRARPDRSQDSKAEDGYVRQDCAIAEIERAGVRLVDSSEIEATPRDTTLWLRGVWTLPPTYHLGGARSRQVSASG